MSYNNKNQIISRFLSTDPTGYSWDDENDWGDDPSQSSYDAGAASDEQAQENDEQRGGYDGGDGSASQITTPVSVFNPPKSIAPTVSALKEFDYTQMTMIDTSLSDSYFGGNIKGAMGDESKSGESGGFWGGVKSVFSGLKNDMFKIIKSGWEKAKEVYVNNPIVRIGLNGFTGALGIGKIGLEVGGPYGALAFGIAGFGFGLTIGAWNEYGFDIPISKVQFGLKTYGLFKDGKWE